MFEFQGKKIIKNEYGEYVELVDKKLSIIDKSGLEARKWKKKLGEQKG